MEEKRNERKPIVCSAWRGTSSLVKVSFEKERNNLTDFFILQISWIIPISHLLSSFLFQTRHFASVGELCWCRQGGWSSEQESERQYQIM